MKFILLFIFFSSVLGKFTKIEDDLDIISDYSSTVSSKIRFEHGGKGKFVIFTSKNQHFLADTEDLANQLCDMLPVPCIVDLIGENTFFI